MCCEGQGGKCAGPEQRARRHYIVSAVLVDRLADFRRCEPACEQADRDAAHHKRDGPAPRLCEQREKEGRGIEKRSPGQDHGDPEDRYRAVRPAQLFEPVGRP